MIRITAFLAFYLILSSAALAGDAQIVKENVLSRFTDSIAGGLENIIGGEGDTEVKITAGEDYKPEFSIMSARPLAIHPSVDAWFVQLQLNETKIRGKGRISTNAGVGYRRLSENKNSMTGMNVFLDYDEKGNARTSVGLELRASAFEAIANYYRALSSGKTVGDFTERTLDGMEISIVGEVPYLPWANIVANHYEWEKNRNSKNSKGEKYSLELTLTPSFVVEAGFDDNNISGNTNFVKVYFVHPPRERVAASTNFIGETAFSPGDMSLELLSRVRRTNKQVIESEGTGVVIGRATE